MEHLTEPEVISPAPSTGFTGQMRSANEAASRGWREIAPRELDEFSQRLLRTKASVLQYPYWNVPYRQLGFRPVFLTWGAGNKPLAYVCVLAAVFGPMRIGLIFRGPVSLSPDEEMPSPALVDLRDWAKGNGLAFLRFTHASGDLLDRIAALGASCRSDAFPLYQDVAAANHDLLIDLTRDEGEILGGFDKEIRRQIRRAADAGCEIQFEDSVEALQQAWPLFIQCAQKKGFRLQKPLEAYAEMVNLARRHDCVRIYRASFRGMPVQFGLILRDRDTAWNVLLARDTDALQSLPSPGPLMHWQAMRDMRREGVRQYNLGLAVGTVGRFKQQFNPVMRTYPSPVTLVTNYPLYAVWARLSPIARFLLPAVRRIALRRK